MYTFKVRIHPNNKQSTKLRQTMNKCIECQNIVYDYLNSFIKEKRKLPTISEVRKWFTVQKGIKDKETKEKRAGLTLKEQREKHLNVLFYDVSNDALKQTVKDTYNSFMKFFKKQSKYPVRKSYKDNKKSFYVDPYKIKIKDDEIVLEKISDSLKRNRTVLNNIKLAEKNRIPHKENIKYYNPRINYDGMHFYITIGVIDSYAPNKNKNKFKESIDSIGIDVNINSIVIGSKDKEIKTFKTFINNDSFNKLTKRLQREQKSISRKYLLAKKEKRALKESKNFIKNKKRIRKLYYKLSCIKEENRNKIVDEIMKEKPSKIVIEDLDIKKMHKNKGLSPFIQSISFSKFLNKVKEKCEFNRIRLVKADRFFPSSKMCSACGNIKNNLTLKMRIYKCDKCGLEIGRDVNAAINLARL